MPCIASEVSSDFLIWAKAKALENLKIPRGECLLLEYYKREHLSYKKRGINLPVKPWKKSSIRSKIVAKFHSWTHRNVPPIKPLWFSNPATAPLFLFLLLPSTYSNLSSILLASTDSSPHAGSDISWLSGSSLTCPSSTRSGFGHFCKSFFDFTGPFSLLNMSAILQAQGDTLASISETTTTSTLTALSISSPYQPLSIFLMP